MEHFVADLGHILGRLEFDLPVPVQVGRTGQGAGVGVDSPVAAVGELIHQLPHGEGEHTTGAGIHNRFAKVVLNGGVVGDPQTHIHVFFAGDMLLGNVDRPQGNAIPAGGGAEQKEGVNNFVVGGGAVALGANHAIAGHRHPIHQQRTRLVAAQAQGIPLVGFGLYLVGINKKAGQIGKISVEAGASGLHNVPIGKARRGCPRRPLRHLPAVGGRLGLGGHRIPKV